MEYIQLSLFGRMCPEHSAATTETTSEPCWKNLPASGNHKLQFLDLRNGAKQDASLEMDGASHGEQWMPNITECRNAADESDWFLILTDTEPGELPLNVSEKPNKPVLTKLSWVLDKNPADRYNLSQKACMGILNRASRRGKELPEILKKALQRIAYPPPQTVIIRSGCDGGGKGALVQTDKSATLSTLQNQTLFDPQTIAIDCRNDAAQAEISATLQSNGYHSLNGINPVAISVNCQGGSQPQCINEASGTIVAATNSSGNNKAAVCYGIGGYHSNAWKSQNPNSGVYVAETARTLDALQCGYPACNQGGTAVAETFTMQGFGDYKESCTGGAVKCRDYKDSTDLVLSVSETDR